MFAFVAQRTRTSLRLRLLVATVALLALALAAAAMAFERVARSVVVDAVHSHLAARAKEVHEAVVRFQGERALTVRNWAEAEAMQMSLDSGDPKFAEDYLRRTIQDQGGAIGAAALLAPDGEIRAAVRAAPGAAPRGIALGEMRGIVVELPGLARTGQDAAVATDVVPLSSLLRGAPEGNALVLTAPVKDFAGDLCGYVVGAVTRDALARLLGEVSGRDGDYRPVVADATAALTFSTPGIDAAALAPVLAAPAGAPGTLERLEPAGGEPALAVRTQAAAAAPRWATLMLVPERVAYGKLTWLRVVLGLLYAGVLLAAAGAGVAAVRQASRPLVDVSASMARVSRGDLTARVHAEYRDELGDLVHSFNVMVEEVARSRDELQRTEALRREVQIAHQIQTAILPVSPAVPGYEVAARMKPADDVGGDLYDILAFEDGFWVLVGDVSGHGINSGLVMMMAQAAAYGAIAEDPRCSPRHVIAAVNRVVHENVRRRMGRDDYLTLMAARHVGDGRFVAAGAHQPIFVVRGPGAVEVVDSPGPWVGLTAGVPPGVTEYEFQVGPGELLCLVTDGMLEAPAAGGELFGEDRLAQVLGDLHGASAPQALGTVFSAVEAFAASQEDDMTTVVLRRKNDDR
ncbi:protein serine/threonine phosphatase [Anaeromyxobacter dehalogenans 2CP-1]|uniref:Protein serine/threonine phosphatase n=1 Tax=Anaeromyxobacter dehalogenans (strain ATCC BAA-258 / DSM 21875 / 2CP-1) TaxID=455488 RepID=B8JEJ6_ANAD2|nr:SpoIIE family protein phosphatase [Anaeromyxobacter dehalogenans]ACL64322.1 protein serine/threonine phosphatase [Anaeromyxobacter dehalogenans 2CP-1]